MAAAARFAGPGDAGRIAWAPASAPQRALLSCPVFEVFFGGARGGGKTDGMIGDWAQHAGTYGRHANGLMIRRSFMQLMQTIKRAKAILLPIGAVFVGRELRMPGGGLLTFAYLKRDSDAENYQGHSYSRIYVEEAGNFPSMAPILMLMACLRSGHGVPCCMRLTGNPGGPGHGWMKARYVDPAPLGGKVLRDPATGLERVYIPARVADNRFLGAAYVNQLRASGSPALVKAWLDGDWSVIAGAYFPEWGASHVLPTQAVPAHWLRFRSFDWGSARPFSAGWWAVADGGMPGVPRGALVRYREWYGMQPGQPNTGLHLTADEVADGIKRREAGDTLAYGVADPAIFTADGGPSIAERMLRRGVVFRRADNARVAQHGAMGGWDAMRARIKGEAGVPMIYAMDCCPDFIRTIPALQHDAARPEDVDTDGEDHAADEGRYACMSRPWMPARVPVLPPLLPGQIRVSDLQQAPRREGRM